MSHLAVQSNVRDVDYKGIDREFAASHPETELVGDEDYRDIMFAADPSPPVYENSAVRPSAEARGNKKFVLVATILLIVLMGAIVATFIDPRVNALVNTLLQKAGIFYSVSLFTI